MYAQRRDANEAEIIAVLTFAGCYCIQMDKSAGFDLLVIKDDDMYVMEIKAPGKESDLTASERARLEGIVMIGGGNYWVVSSAEQALNIIGR